MVTYISKFIEDPLQVFALLLPAISACIVGEALGSITVRCVVHSTPVGVVLYFTYTT